MTAQVSEFRKENMNELKFTDQVPVQEGEYYRNTGSVILRETIDQTFIGDGLLYTIDDLGDHESPVDKVPGQWLRIPTAHELVALGERMERMEKALALCEEPLHRIGSMDALRITTMEFAEKALAAIQEARKA